MRGADRCHRRQVPLLRHDLRSALARHVQGVPPVAGGLPPNEARGSAAISRIGGAASSFGIVFPVLIGSVIMACGPQLFKMALPIMLGVGVLMSLIGSVFYYMLCVSSVVVDVPGRSRWARRLPATPSASCSCLVSASTGSSWRSGASRETSTAFRGNSTRCAPRVNEQLAFVACILHIFTVAPFLGGLHGARHGIPLVDAGAMLALIGALLTFIEIKHMCATAIAINEGLCRT